MIRHKTTGRSTLGCSAAIFILLAVIFVLSRPLIYWLVAIILATSIVEHYKAKYAKRVEKIENVRMRARLKSAFVASALETTEEVGWCVSLGVAIVAVCNLCLRLFKADIGFYVDPDTVFRIENSLVLLETYLEKNLQPKLAVLVCVLSALLIATVVVPKLRLIQRWDSLQTIVHRVVLVLCTITAFTFFTTKVISSDKSKWASEMSETVNFQLSNIGAERKRIMAAAVVEAMFDNLPQGKKDQLKTLFQEAAGRPHAKDIVALESVDLIHSDQSVKGIVNALTPPEETPENRVLRRVEELSPTVGSGITFSDVVVVEDQSHRSISDEVDSEFEIARIFVKNVLGGTFSDKIGDKVSEMASRFVEMLIDSVSESIADALFPGPSNLDAARVTLRNSDVDRFLRVEVNHIEVWNLEHTSGLSVAAIVNRDEELCEKHAELIPKTKSERDWELWQREYAATEEWLREWKEEHPDEGEGRGEE